MGLFYNIVNNKNNYEKKTNYNYVHLFYKSNL